MEERLARTSVLFYSSFFLRRMRVSAAARRGENYVEPFTYQCRASRNNQPDHQSVTSGRRGYQICQLVFNFIFGMTDTGSEGEKVWKCFTG